MDEGLRQYYLEQLGIERWLPRDGTTVDSAAPPAPAGEEIPGPGVPGDTAALDWLQLEQRVAACTACSLHASRTRTVFGTGNHQASWMLIGEAPGADEDRQGEPFVGRAGQLLNAMLAAIGLKREEVYIANILKCRPPRNRDPLPEEVTACEAYLARQVELVAPDIILALGGVAAKNLLRTDAPVGRLRGERHTYADTGIPLVVTYHPAYLLRSPGEKRRSWQDLKFARRLAAGARPGA